MAAYPVFVIGDTEEACYNIYYPGRNTSVIFLSHMWFQRLFITSSSFLFYFILFYFILFSFLFFYFIYLFIFIIIFAYSVREPC